MVGNNLTNNKPLVSVIMNCLDGEKYLREAIDSVLAQTYPNWELIIWDNQSSDNTAVIAKTYTDKRVKYYRADKFTSLGEARNLAIGKSVGEIIGFLDCDDLWFPRKLEKQIPLFNNPEVGIVICNTLFFNEKGTQKKLYKKKNPPIGRVFKSLLSEYFVSLETAVIRMQALKSLDYWFDSRFEAIEEYDLFVRLGYYWELAYVDEILAKWRVHSSSGTWTRSELFPMEKIIMLKTLSKSIPNFTEKYSTEINKVERSIAFEKTQISWQNGNKRKAREYIKPHINGSIKYRLFYLLTFFPFGLYKLLQYVRGAVHPA